MNNPYITVPGHSNITGILNCRRRYVFCHETSKIKKNNSYFLFKMVYFLSLSISISPHPHFPRNVFYEQNSPDCKEVHSEGVRVCVYAHLWSSFRVSSLARSLSLPLSPPPSSYPFYPLFFNNFYLPRERESAADRLNI